MAKYIIDIPDDRVCDYVGSTHLLMPYMMAGHKGHHDTGLNLTPYTEPDRKQIEDEVWDLIEDEVWELARLISLEAYDGGLSRTELYECYKCSSIQDVMKTHSYQEAKAKYEAWKAEKESKIEVGDGVYGKINQKNGVVVRIYADDVYSDCVGVMWEDGGLDPFCKIEGLQKTGRHFSQLSDLLKAMKGEK